MRIGIVTTWFERGAAYVSRQYRDALERAGHEVFVYARGGEAFAVGDPNWDGPRIHWAARSADADRSGISSRDFRRWLRETGVSAVLFNEQRTLGPVALCDRAGVKTVAYVDYYTKDTVRDFAIYDGLICNTRRHASVFDWHPRCLFVPWGTDTGLFQPFGRWPELVEPGVVTFFHSAGFAPRRKGTDLLLRAFDRVKTPAKLVIHSQKNILSVFPDLRETVNRLRSSGRLTFLEETIPAPGAYHRGDVYVYPSRLDGIGLTVCEALSCGLPVIVPDEPPMNEFPDGGSGEFVRVARREPRWDGYYWPMCVADEDSLAEAMERLAQDPFRVCSMKRNARNLALRERSWISNATAVSPFFGSLTVGHDEALVRSFSRRRPLMFLRDFGRNLRRRFAGRQGV